MSSRHEYSKFYKVVDVFGSEGCRRNKTQPFREEIIDTAAGYIKVGMQGYNVEGVSYCFAEEKAGGFGEVNAFLWLKDKWMVSKKKLTTVDYGGIYGVFTRIQ